MPIKEIKPLRSICPRCSAENVTTELNFEGYDEQPDAFHQSHITCNVCKYNYIMKAHLADPENKVEIIP